MDNYNLIPGVLLDVKGKKINPWEEKKKKSILLSESYYRLGKKKYDRVFTCSDWLEFRRYKDNSLKLNNANFCKDRLCPMCSWRRSLKIFGQTSKILNHVESAGKYRYLFLTLTVRNVYADELQDEITHLFKSFDRLMKRRLLKNVIKGCFRALEVTFNKDTGTFHPHFHIILCVMDSYFGNTYISHDKWVRFWRESARLDYDPNVDIRSFKKNYKGVAEASKYTVKDTDFIIKDNPELTDKLVSVFDDCLRGRRLVSYTGIFKKAHSELKLDDTIDGDLVNNSELRDDLDYVIEFYRWNVGIGNYQNVRH